MSIGIEVDVSALQREVQAWADIIFADRTTASVLAHLREEVGELEIAVDSEPWVRTPETEAAWFSRIAEECADVGLLLMSLTSLIGEDLASLMAVKHALNKGRRWTRQMDGYRKHTEEETGDER